MHVDEAATYYSATKKYNLNFTQIEQDIETDVMTIGGGISGIHTALALAEQGLKDVVVGTHCLGFGGQVVVHMGVTICTH